VLRGGFNPLRGPSAAFRPEPELYAASGDTGVWHWIPSDVNFGDWQASVLKRILQGCHTYPLKEGSLSPLRKMQRYLSQGEAGEVIHGDA